MEATTLGEETPKPTHHPAAGGTTHFKLLPNLSCVSVGESAVRLWSFKQEKGDSKAQELDTGCQSMGRRGADLMSQSHLLPPAIAGSLPWRVSIHAFHLSRMHLSATCSASCALSILSRAN